MATMPGLPMFGHGQIEGFSEKYGMEFRRAYWNETPDNHLVERHEKEIFPLLRKRYVFADVKDFLLYDFFTQEGSVNEDVFAFSNRSNEERSLVIYQNRYADTRGWIRSSVAYSVKAGPGDSRRLVQKSLGKGLGLHGESGYFTIFRDQISGLEYIRSSQEIQEQGLFVELGAYQYHVFLEFREVLDNEWRHYSQLDAFLDGRGVPSVAEALKEIFLQPVHFPFRQLVNAGSFQWLVANQLKRQDGEVKPEVLDEVEGKSMRLLQEIDAFTQSNQDEGTLLEIAALIRREIEAILAFPVLENRYQLGKNGQFPRLETLIGWACVHALGEVTRAEDAASISRSWIDEWLLGRILLSTFHELGIEEGSAWREVELIRILTSHQEWFEFEGGEDRVYPILRSWLEDSDVQRFIQVNRYQGVLWFNHESFEDVIDALMSIAIVNLVAQQELTGGDHTGSEVENRLRPLVQIIQQIRAAEKESGYQVEKLLEAVPG
jgi:hypothetical protein